MLIRHLQSSQQVHKQISSSLVILSSSTLHLHQCKRFFGEKKNATPAYGYYNTGDSRWSDGNSGYNWKQRSLDEQRSLAIDYMFNVAKRTPIHDGVRMKAKQSQSVLVKSRTHLNSQQSQTEKESAADIVAEAAKLSASAGMSTIEELNDYNRLMMMEEEEQNESELDRLMMKRRNEKNNKNINKKPKTEEELLNSSIFDDIDFGGGGDDDILDDECFGEVLDSLRNIAIPKEDLELLTREVYGEASEAANESRDKMLTNWFKLRSNKAPHSIFAANLEEERNMWTPWYLKNERS
jgi:Cft2 family RNA processing exonuclease